MFSKYFFESYSLLGSISAETFPVIDLTRTIQRYPEDFHLARQLEAEARPFLHTNTAKIFFSMVSIRTPVNEVVRQLKVTIPHATTPHFYLLLVLQGSQLKVLRYGSLWSQTKQKACIQRGNPEDGPGSKPVYWALSPPLRVSPGPSNLRCSCCVD